jgi:hypothetical protein
MIQCDGYIFFSAVLTTKEKGLPTVKYRNVLKKIPTDLLILEYYKDILLSMRYYECVLCILLDQNIHISK